MLGRHFAAHPLGDIVHRREQRVFALEAGGSQVQPAAALDVNLLMPIDHDLGNAGVFNQRLNGPQAEELVRDAVPLPALDVHTSMQQAFGELFALPPQWIDRRRNASDEFAAKAELTALH